MNTIETIDDSSQNEHLPSLEAKLVANLISSKQLVSKNMKQSIAASAFGAVAIASHLYLDLDIAGYIGAGMVGWYLPSAINNSYSLGRINQQIDYYTKK